MEITQADVPQWRAQLLQAGEILRGPLPLASKQRVVTQVLEATLKLADMVSCEVLLGIAPALYRFSLKEPTD